MVTISQPFGNTVGYVIFSQEASSASVGNTVCRADDTAESTLFFFSFFSGVIDQEVFVGRPCKALFGNPFQESFFVQCSRVERDNVISAKHCYGIIEFVAFGHPTHTVSCIIQKNLSGFQLRELTVCTRAFGSMVVPITGQQVFSTRRDRNGDNTVAVHCIIQ